MYQQVARRGRRVGDTFLLLRALPNALEESRFGLAVGKDVGTAVIRNRLKRRLREVLRHTPVRKGWDIVFSVRKEAVRATFGDLKGSVLSLLKRAHLLEGAS